MSVCASASLKTDVLAFWFCLFSVQEYLSKKETDWNGFSMQGVVLKPMEGIIWSDCILFLPVYVYPSSPSLCWIISSLDKMTMDSKVRYYM